MSTSKNQPHMGKFLFRHGILIICIVIIVWAVTSTFTTLSSATHIPAIPDQRPHIIARPNPSQYHIFGHWQSSLDDLPNTTLPIRLQGTEVITNGTSSAILSVQGAKAKSFDVGEQLMSGVTLQKVKVDRIVINDHGTMYQLKLPIPKAQ